MEKLYGRTNPTRQAVSPRPVGMKGVMATRLYGQTNPKLGDDECWMGVRGSKRSSPASSLGQHCRGPSMTFLCHRFTSWLEKPRFWTGPTGFEPATTGSTVRYSSQLSYGPTYHKSRDFRTGLSTQGGSGSGPARRLGIRHGAASVHIVRIGTISGADKYISPHTSVNRRLRDLNSYSIVPLFTK